MTTLDAHVHVWDLDLHEYAWLGPQHGGLYASFSPEQAQEAIASCGIGAAVLVQAEDSTAETEYMLRVADRYPWVAGVVGWLPLADPEATAARAQVRRLLESAVDELLGVIIERTGVVMGAVADSRITESTRSK